MVIYGDLMVYLGWFNGDLCWFMVIYGDLNGDLMVI